MAQTAANHTGKGVERHTEIKYKNNCPEAGFGADFCFIMGLNEGLGFESLFVQK